MKEIALTDGTMALVSDHHYLDVVYQGNWYNNGKYPYRRFKINGKWTQEYMHIFIAHELMGLKGEIDHCDLDGFNNTEENLREATRSQNRMNQRARRDNKLRAKGVSEMSNGRYEVRINKDKKQCYREYFDSLEEAKEAYRLASIKYHGEYGRTK